jgi:hypothetical protein
MPLPVDFEERVRRPPAVNGGYPYSISAKDLMDNFKYLDNKKGGTGGITFVDCDGNVLLQFDWKDGQITSSGFSTIQVGCDGSGGSSST